MSSSRLISDNSNSLRGKINPLTTKVILAFALFFSILGVYNPASHNQFINFDDDVYVSDNAHVKGGLSWEMAKWALTTTDEANWHPLTWFSHAIDCEVFGLDPRGHHYVNVLLHGFNVVLLFLLLEGATASLWRSFMVAALWGLHPLNVESVAWIAERKNVLSALFFLITFTAYTRYARRPSATRYLPVVLCFALGLMSKPQVITLPWLLLLWDYWPLERIPAQAAFEVTARSNGLQRSWFLLEKTPLVLMAAASAWITVKAQSSSGAVQAQYSFNLRLENAIVGYIRYVQKAFWPSHLALIYPYPVNGIAWWIVAASAAALVIVSVFVFAKRQHRYLVTGWLWFLGSLVPMIGVIQVGRQAMADRYAYLPLMGLLIVAIWGLAELLSRIPFRRFAVCGVVSAIVLVLSATVTIRQTHYWRDSISVWTQALSVTHDNPVAEDNLGQALNSAGQGDKAYPHFLRAAALDPGDPISHANLGAYLHAHGNLISAVEQYEMAIALGGDRRIQGRTHGNLGIAFQQLGEEAKAREQFQRALQIWPGQFNACFGLGVILQKEGKLNEALSQFYCSLNGRPTSDAFVHVGQIMQELGHQDQARSAYLYALQLQPGQRDAEKGLAVLTGNQLP